MRQFSDRYAFRALRNFIRLLRKPRTYADFKIHRRQTRIIRNSFLSKRIGLYLYPLSIWILACSLYGVPFKNKGFPRYCHVRLREFRFHRYSKCFNVDYSTRGQVHLPGKELRYLRTVRVTADIDEGLAPRAAKRPLALTYADLFYRRLTQTLFSCPRLSASSDISRSSPRSSAIEVAPRPKCLTFSHWSGVSPYTSSYELAGTCVFGKQSPEILSLRPQLARSARKS